MTAPADCRQALSRAALAAIPKLLTLQDRTPTSPTYGCFDRDYWHYRVMDFPCGMSAEFSLPLALAWSLPMPGTPYFRQPEVRRWAEAGIRFAARSAHANGACDDYYPFEQAVGAAAFSLFACLEAAAILGIAQDEEVLAFTRRRARWLAQTRESGRLANHEALIVACLARLAQRDSEWSRPLRDRLDRLLSWQSSEGWFAEYGGADPGYLSLTIAMLAEAERRTADRGLRQPIAQAVRFLAEFVHPDGTVGGGYTSRGTVCFFPHGLEIAGAWLPDALELDERALRPLADGRAPCFADDRLIGHQLWSRMLAWREWVVDRPARRERNADSAIFPDAKLLVTAREETSLYLGWGRGGAFRLYRGARLLQSDTGPSIRMRDGRVAVTHLQEQGHFNGEAQAPRVSGRMVWARHALQTPGHAILLRLVMLAGGRRFPDRVRRLLQGLLVTGRRQAPFAFERSLAWRDGAWEVTDTIIPRAGWQGVAAIGLGGFQTSMTTAMARVWEPEQFQPWQDWSERIAALRDDEPLVVQRRFAPALTIAPAVTPGIAPEITGAGA